MNFYGHALLAARHRDSPGFVLGAMLPDFASMAGLGLPELDDEVLSAGVAFHHATDAAFHRLPWFVSLCADGTEWLESRGLGRGSARAVAHVGSELLLDGALSHHRHGVASYERALSYGVSALDAGALAAVPQSGRLSELLRRLWAAPIPNAYQDTQFVTTRLQHALAPRPRLRLDDAHEPVVRAWLERARPTVAAQARDLLPALAATR